MEVMRVTRHNRSIGSPLALVFALSVGFLAAAAQSGSEAVVCVGSETPDPPDEPDPKGLHGRHGGRVPDRRGHRPARPDGARSRFGARLLSGGVARVVRSRDDHAVIISYTGVIRQDLTVDPEDPRFQAFSDVA